MEIDYFVRGFLWADLGSEFGPSLPLLLHFISWRGIESFMVPLSFGAKVLNVTVA
jgi:hypothetical protein